jgi:hypothetical protein
MAALRRTVERRFRRDQRRRFVARSTLTRGIVQIKPKQANEKAAQD